MKVFKNFIVLIMLVFCCFAVLFSCGEKESGINEVNEINIDLQDLLKVIGDRIDLSDTIEYADMILNETGITNFTRIAVLKEMDVLSAEVLILVEANDKTAANEIVDKLKVYKTNKLNELRDYDLNPDNERQYYIVEDSEIIIEQKYVFFVINTESKEINNIIKDYIKNSKTK